MNSAREVSVHEVQLVGGSGAVRAPPVCSAISLSVASSAGSGVPSKRPSGVPNAIVETSTPAASATAAAAASGPSRVADPVGEQHDRRRGQARGGMVVPFVDPGGTRDRRERLEDAFANGGPGTPTCGPYCREHAVVILRCGHLHHGPRRELHVRDAQTRRELRDEALRGDPRRLHPRGWNVVGSHRPRRVERDHDRGDPASHVDRACRARTRQHDEHQEQASSRGDDTATDPGPVRDDPWSCTVRRDAPFDRRRRTAATIGTATPTATTVSNQSVSGARNVMALVGPTRTPRAAPPSPGRARPPGSTG